MDKSKEYYEKEMQEFLNRRYAKQSVETEVKTKTVYNPIYKLLSGIVMLILSSFLIFYAGIEGIEKFVSHLKNSGLNEKVSVFIGFCINIIALVYFIKGIYRIGTFNQYLTIFEHDRVFSARGLFDGSWSTVSQSNIDRMLSYRESKMANMNNDEAADFLVATSGLDAVKNGIISGSNTERAASYVESKLNNMDGEKGMAYFAKK